MDFTCTGKHYQNWSIIVETIITIVDNTYLENTSLLERLIYGKEIINTVVAWQVFAEIFYWD